MGESSDELKLGAAGSRHESLLAEGQLRSASLSSWGMGVAVGKLLLGRARCELLAQPYRQQGRYAGKLASQS